VRGGVTFHGDYSVSTNLIVQLLWSVPGSRPEAKVKRKRSTSISGQFLFKT
jgi:hypothetical protein